MNLTTTAKVKEHIGIPAADTSRDNKIGALIPGVSKYIEGQCSRNFEYTSYDFKLSGDGTDELMLPIYPVKEIVSLAIDGVDLTEAQIDSLDIDQKTGIVYAPAGIVFSSGRRNIEISVMAGYIDPDESQEGDIPTIPEDLELAARRLTAKIYEKSTAEGVVSVGGTFKVQYADAADEDIKETIGRYSRIKVA